MPSRSAVAKGAPVPVKYVRPTAYCQSVEPAPGIRAVGHAVCLSRTVNSSSRACPSAGKSFFFSFSLPFSFLFTVVRSFVLSVKNTMCPSAGKSFFFSPFFFLFCTFFRFSTLNNFPPPEIMHALLLFAVKKLKKKTWRAGKRALIMTQD